MYLVADILLILYLALFIYRGLKFKGTVHAFIWLFRKILVVLLGIGSAFAIAFFLFPMLGLIQEFQLGLLDFAHSFAGILKLANIEGLTHEDIAYYLAIGITTIVLSFPMYFFFKWLNNLLYRYCEWLLKSCTLLKVVACGLAAIVNVAIGGAIALAFFWFVAAVDGSGLFTYTNEVFRAGYLTGLIYEYNPLYSFLGEHGSLAETVGNFISGNF